MSIGLIGYKLRMTQVFTAEGKAEPVTVLQLGPCPVLQIKHPAAQSGTARADGYAAVQLGFQDKKRKNATRPEQGHVAAGLKSKRKDARQKAGVALPPKADCEPQKVVREFRLDRGDGFVVPATVKAGPAEASFKVERIKVSGEGATKKYDLYTEDMTVKVGDKLTIDAIFKDVLAVDVIGMTKGRGTAGVMKRHNFAGLPAAHGAKKVHRQAGSTSSLASNRGSGRPKKGLRRAGRYGNERVTIRNLTIVKVDLENNLLLIRGGIPGFPGSVVMVRPTNKVGPGSPKAKTKKREAPAVAAKKK